MEKIFVSLETFTTTDLFKSLGQTGKKQSCRGQVRLSHIKMGWTPLVDAKMPNFLSCMTFLPYEILPSITSLHKPSILSQPSRKRTEKGEPVHLACPALRCWYQVCQLKGYSQQTGRGVCLFNWSGFPANLSVGAFCLFSCFSFLLHRQIFWV